MAVDIDRYRQIAGRRNRNGGGERVGSRSGSPDIRSSPTQTRCIGRGLGGQRGGTDRSRCVGAVGSGEDKITREGIVGNGDQEVGRPSRDHRVGSRENSLGGGERVTRGLEINRIGAIDEGVVGGKVGGGGEGAGVAVGVTEEGVDRGRERSERGEVQRAAERGHTGDVEEAGGGAGAEEDIERAATDGQSAKRQGAGSGSVTRKDRSARHRDRAGRLA